MATITKTISNTEAADASTIQGGFDLCADDGNDYVLNIIDHSTYTEQAVLGARPAGGVVTLKPLIWSRASRPVIAWSGSDGNVLEFYSRHKVFGIKFDYSEPVQGSDFRRCIYADQSSVYSEVGYCKFYLGGRYYYNASPLAEYGHVGYWADYHLPTVKAYNNLYRNCAYAGVRYDPVAGDDVKIWNNAFVKSQECIWVETNALNVGEIWNNIFDQDGNYGPDCTKFYAIYVNDNYYPTRFKYLDYNLYHQRELGHSVEPLHVFKSWNHQYDTVADMKAAYPTVEIHGLSSDPIFCQYCVDYHINGSSPAKGSGLLRDALADDQDLITRPNPPARGAYEGGCSNVAIIKNTFVKGRKSIKAYSFSPSLFVRQNISDIEKARFGLTSVTHIEGPDGAAPPGLHPDELNYNLYFNR